MRLEHVTRHGMILEVSGEAARVRLAPVDGEPCGDSCASCGACASDDDAEVVSVHLPEPASTGDRVEIEIVAPNAAVAAGFVFGMPLLTVALGAAVGYAVGGGADGFVLGGGAAGLFAGIAAIYVLERMLRKRCGMGIRVVSVSRAESDA